MEWVETTGRTVEEAKDRALDQLGVSEDDAEFDVLESPRPGLFGRVRGEARVRARVRPTTPRAKVERRDRRGKKSSDAVTSGDDAVAEAVAAEPAAPAARAPRAPRAPRAAAAPAPAAAADTDKPARAPRAAKSARSATAAAPKTDSAPREPMKQTGDPDVAAQEVGEEAVRFLDGLVEAFGLEATCTLALDGDEIEVQVNGTDLGILVGPRGATLLAIQDLTRVVSQRRLGDHETRLRIDIAGYRERRRAALSRFTQEQAEAVKASGQARVLEPMPSADRKVIHDTIATIDGVSSRSEGDDPFRRVVIVPAAAGS